MRCRYMRVAGIGVLRVWLCGGYDYVCKYQCICYCSTSVFVGTRVPVFWISLYCGYHFVSDISIYPGMIVWQVSLCCGN
jgi:hypothetical protein